MEARAHYRAAQQCPLCGLPKTVCRAMETDGMVGVTTERCHVSTAIARARKASEQAEMQYPEGLAYEAALYDEEG